VYICNLLSKNSSGLRAEHVFLLLTVTVYFVSCFPNCHIQMIFTLYMQGIPYAIAPVGKFRWHEATPVSTDTANCPSELKADSYGNRCVQLDSSSTLTGSEDCLFLNVWTPSDIDSSSQLDVVVHIHDGGLMTGSGHEPCEFIASSVFLIVLCEHTKFRIKYNS